MALTANTYSGIKSIQRGTAVILASNLTVTATVTAVVTGKSTLNIVGQVPANTTTDYLAYGVVTNATTLTFTRNSNGAFTSTISWELVEWY